MGEVLFVFIESGNNGFLVMMGICMLIKRLGYMY